MGRDDLEVTHNMKLLISAQAVILTFGFRDFFIGLIDRIYVYPNKFYSSAIADYKTSEVNPRMKTLVISWSDFYDGLEMSSTNCRGVYQFTHAIHLNCIKEGDISSTIFEDSFKEMAAMLTKDSVLRQSLLNSRFFKGYVFLNQFDFLAVIMEHFIERPQEFRGQFPEIYAKTKQMLNFNYEGY